MSVPHSFDKLSSQVANSNRAYTTHIRYLQGVGESPTATLY